MFDSPPFSQGRMARILFIYELAYRWRKLPMAQRSSNNKRKIIDECSLDKSEAITFLDIIRNFSSKEIRRYLLENGSKIVRRGKRTRMKKIKVVE